MTEEFLTEQPPQQKIMVQEELSRTLNALFYWKNIPDEIKNEFWTTFNRDLGLNFLTEDDLDYLLNELELEKLYLMNSMREQDYTNQIMLLFNRLKQFRYLEIKRSIGVRGNVNNERLILAKSIMEQIQTKPEEKKRSLL